MEQFLNGGRVQIHQKRDSRNGVHFLKKRNTFNLLQKIL